MNADIANYLVLDFEATCDNNPAASGFNPSKQEIIEFPVALISLSEKQIIDRFDRMVRPVLQPQLTEFCTELTSIEQWEVEKAQPIEEVAAEFEKWTGERDLNEGNSLAVTCGDWDLKTMWPLEAINKNMSTPAVLERWCNLKLPVTDFLGIRPRIGMMGMLRALEIEHEGRHHRGKDDVTNLAKIVIHLLENEVYPVETYPAESP